MSTQEERAAFLAAAELGHEVLLTMAHAGAIISNVLTPVEDTADYTGPRAKVEFFFSTEAESEAFFEAVKAFGVVAKLGNEITPPGTILQ